jgi:Xaa-Pro aminopeptidase
MKKNFHLSALREKLEEKGIAGFIIPSNDEFQNEYVPSHLNRLKFITGFTGSNGVAIITKSKVVFFTDSRYLLQARKELDSEYSILNMYDKNSCNRLDLGLENGSILGYDPMLHTSVNLDYYKKLADKSNFKLKALENNLIDDIWQERPEEEVNPAFEADVEFAGKSREDKINEVCQQIDEEYLLITDSTTVCWLLNIRAYDIECTPILLANMILAKNGSGTLYCNPRKISLDIPRIRIKPLEDLKNDFKTIILDRHSIQIDPRKVPVFFSGNPDYKDRLLFKDDPIDLMKACKNATEIDGFRKAHFQDGLAITKFLHLLFENWQNFNEAEAAEKLTEFRSSGEHFFSLSFPTISAYGPNGAIIHYKPDKRDCKKLHDDSFYLLDSGGQYLNGTTDVTRTMHFGNPTIEQKKHFTLVLKGYISLAKARFPQGTTGAQLDALARFHLWQYGLDYAHGTGHGVGHFLSVHEGPHKIGKGGSASQELLKGMIVSNEPGCYLENRYGIRIESLLLVVESDIPGFLEFETLTVVPIQYNLVDESMLSIEEKNRLLNYNMNVAEKLSNHLNKQEKEFVSKISFQT